MSTESSLDGARPVFASTIWSDILAAGNPAHPESRQKLDVLLRRYWKPVFAYIRSAWNCPIEDAKDLTQAFFTRMIEKEYWANLRPDRGSFRGYLRMSLKHFLINARDHDAVRRPQGGRLISIDLPDAERIDPPARGESPDAVYDREWFRCVMDGATAALKEMLARDGKQVYFDVFAAYCFGPDPEDPPTRGELASKFGIRDSDVQNYLAHCRRELKVLVRAAIADYVHDPADVESELREAAGG